jgi:lipoprotein-releasing system ATP-binding protein
MTSTPFIAISGLNKRYWNGEGRALQILRDLELCVSGGDTVAIMGPSGAGKSTLLHLIGALDRPDEGRVDVGGQNVAILDGEAAARFRNETIGFVFQFHHLLMDFTALENVMMPMWIRAGRTSDVTDRAKSLLDSVGLADRFNHRPSQLSGGEQQRVAIARAIANQPKLLLADEPTGNLDEESARQVSDLLFNLNRRQGLTLLIVTHNPDLAARTGATFVLEHGRLRSVTVSPADA